MMIKYQPKDFEKKWMEKWRQEKLYSFKFDPKTKKYYVLVELPYTSGDLHIGHWFAFTIPDVLARFKRMDGYNVFFPNGFDAFGLPAENAAIKRHIHPKDWTMKNIRVMKDQYQTMGTMIDWDSMAITCLPEYYRWNQWIFIKMWEKGIVYRGKALSNWCEKDKTVLANENVENGKCWRCGSQVVQKQVEQWFLKITDYADRLEWGKSPVVDWPMSVRVGQNNWIGKKEGINMDYPVKDACGEVITCFTTAPVNFGMTFIVIAPEHELIKKILNPKSEIRNKYKISNSKIEEIKEYVEKAKNKSEMDRLVESREKTGVFTGLYATNRIAGWDVPVWVSDFVIGHVGTGAVQGCPGHDYKDFEFAKKFNIPIIRVVEGKDGDKSPIEKTDQIIIKGMKGKMCNSKFLDGLDFADGLEKTMDYAEEKGWGKRTITYHIRDWSISRQRYWGTPTPIIHCNKCGIVPVSEKELPVELPYEVDFTPHGKPPLATNEKWLNVKCPKCGSSARRDAETLDTFFDSSWYWFRYLDPKYNKAPFDTNLAKKLTPVDIYFGGSEHTLGHTLYARFFTKFFKDIGLVDYDEFALKRFQHGVVLGPDGNRMSKSKGNVINPDDVVKEYGADTVRMYLCFMMPYGATSAWSTTTIAGVNRFLNRVWKMYQSYKNDSVTQFLSHENLTSSTSSKGPLESEKITITSLISKLNKTIEKVTKDIEQIKMNTAIAAMMEFMNEWEKSCNVKRVTLNAINAKKFLQILAPFAPFISDEIWRTVFNEKESIHLSAWPKIDEKSIDAEEEIIIPVQVNGKLRATIKIQNSKFKIQNEVVNTALKEERVNKYLKGKKYKMIYIAGKILNFVII